MGTQEILIVFVIVYFSGWVMGTWVLMLFFSMIKDCLKKEKGETNGIYRSKLTTTSGEHNTENDTAWSSH